MATFPHVTKTKASKAAAPIGGFVSPTPRIASIRAELFSTPYSICLERPRLLGEFHRSRQGHQSARTEHSLVQRALALNYIFSHRTPRIYDGELIIGNMTSKRIAANYYIEGGSINILEDFFRLGKRTIPLKLSGRETAELLFIGLRNAFKSVGAKALLKPGRISYFLDFFRAKRHFITEEAGVGHQVGNYRMVVHEGLCRPYEEADKGWRRAGLRTAPLLMPIRGPSSARWSSRSTALGRWRKIWLTRHRIWPPGRVFLNGERSNSWNRRRRAAGSPLNRPGPTWRVCRPPGLSTWH